MSVSTITREVISVVPDTSRLEFFSAELLRKLTWPGRTAKDEEGRARGQSGEDEGGNDDGCGDAKGSGNVKLVWGEGGSVDWCEEVTRRMLYVWVVVPWGQESLGLGKGRVGIEIE